jgi:fucose permease
MSKLHSIYAWGVVFVVVFSTLFLLLFGSKNWHWLALIFAIIPLVSFLLFMGANIPHLETPGKVSGVLELMKSKTLWLCFILIFFGGASEVAMAQWSSSFLEKASGLPKVWGDMFGVALFSVMLGLGRTLYAKFGKNITKILLLGAIGAAICYFTVAVCDIPIVGVIACALTGLCTTMLWPGSLIVATDRFPQGGVFIFAMMAAGGDLGASVAPQIIGIVNDVASKLFASEQLGMKCGLLVGMLFPLISIPFYIHSHRESKRAQS